MNEANVICYAAGYTLRTVKKKKEALSHLKEEMALCIRAHEDDMEVEYETVEWVTIIDRGGLWHIKPGTYLLFCAIEEEFCSYLNDIVSGMREISNEVRDAIVSAIIKSDDVAFYWCMLCTN